MTVPKTGTKCAATLVVLIAVLGALPVTGFAQVQDPAQPGTTTKKTPPPVPPLTFKKSLPTAPVAKIDGAAVTQGDLIKQLLKDNISVISQALLTAKMAELEVARAKIQITPESLQAEIEEMVGKLAPGKTLEQVLASGAYARKDLERQAFVNRAWKELFWKERNIPDDQKNTQAQTFLLQIYMKGIVDKYKRSMRGEDPSPPDGAVASLQWTENNETKTYLVTTEEACDFMFGLLKPRSLEEGLDTLIDNALFEREMKSRNVTVTDTEIEAWAAEQNAKYQPPFGWAQICRWKGTTPDKEKERFGRIQAWKRIGNVTIHDEDLVSFRKEHEDYFRSRTVNVSHILIKTVDDVTGMPKAPNADETALATVKTILEKLDEGIEFETLVERFSEDDGTKATKGKLGQPVKKWGGGYDAAFATAAYALKTGEVSAPVKSQFGYHIIRCDKVNSNETTQINFDEPRYREWITDEYETKRMEEYLANLRASARIEKVPVKELVAIKDLTLSEPVK